MRERTFQVYTITGPDGVYVGSTGVSAHRRWMSHKCNARRGHHERMYRAIRHYGESAFTIAVIAEFKIEDEAREFERGYIAAADLVGVSLYNRNSGASGNRCSEASPDQAAQPLAPAGTAPTALIAIAHPPPPREPSGPAVAVPAGASPCTESR